MLKKALLPDENRYQIEPRPNHSCETSLLQMINNRLDAINSSQMIGMVMIDFRKEFDLVDHTLLLKNSNTTKYQKRLLAGFLLIC